MIITNWALYEKLLVEKVRETFIIFIEATKHYKQDPTNVEAEKHFNQALANHKDAKKRRAAWNIGIEERLDGIERLNAMKEEGYGHPNHQSHS